MRSYSWAARTALLAGLTLAALPAQTPSLSGHWEGTVQTPNQDLRLVLDIARNEKGDWIGDLDVPDQSLSGAVVSAIKLDGAAFSFRVELPGNPVFSGKISEDGKSLSGNTDMGANAFPVQFKRTGEAKVTLPPPGTPLGKEFEGAWEGTLEAGGQSLRLVFHLARAADGTGKGSLDSLDQNALGIPVSTVIQKGREIDLQVKVVNGSLTAKLNEAGTTLAGDWTQNGNTFPLSLKKQQ